MYARAAQTYKTLAGETASPARQVQMILDGMLTWLDRADAAQAADRPTERVIAIDRAMALLEHLQAALDFSADPALAATLQDLYLYVQRGLLEANSTAQREPLDACRPVLRQLRDTWAEVAG